ncbi:hypothetical protein GCM10023209_00270 [Roseibacterium beibuensis]|uniref:Uncharacterized protein n=1 Tax=[Roseibacterium] beibuensis TaxID=1193142 RepID=A0ABP9KUJ3_9RHOB
MDGTALFRTHGTGGPVAAQAQLARAAIWSRVFPNSAGWLHLWLPGDKAVPARLEAALSGSEE